MVNTLLHYYDYHMNAPFNYNELLDHYNDFFGVENHFSDCDYQNAMTESRMGCGSRASHHIFLMSNESIEKEKVEFKACRNWSQFESITWCKREHSELCSFGKSLGVTPSEIVLWDRCNRRCINNFAIDFAEKDQITKILSTAIFNYRKKIENDGSGVSEEKWILAKFFWFSYLLWGTGDNAAQLENPIFWSNLPSEVLVVFFEFFDSIIDYTSVWDKKEEWPEQVNDLLIDRQIFNGLRQLTEDDLFCVISENNIISSKGIIIKEFQRTSSQLKKIAPYRSSLTAVFKKLEENGINLTKDNRPGFLSPSSPWISESFKNYAATSNPDFGNKRWKHKILSWAISTELISILELSERKRNHMEYTIDLILTIAIESKPEDLNLFFTKQLSDLSPFYKFEATKFEELINKLVTIFDITKG